MGVGDHRSIHREILEGPLTKSEKADCPGIYSSDDDHLFAGLQHGERVRFARRR